MPTHNLMRRLKRISGGALICAGSAVGATDFSVEFVNLTHGIYYTPLLVAAHPVGSSLFEAGQPASANLQAMAEGGDIAGLVSDLNGLGATVVENPAGGVLAPGGSTSVAMNTDGTGNDRLSIVAMLLPTNDAFVGLNAIEIPTQPGSYVFTANAYDAATEANDEIINGGGAPGVAGIPADPGGAGGSGGSGAASADMTSTVHIHRNTLGDTDPAAGVSDLDSRVHRWLNPVARIVVTVN